MAINQTAPILVTGGSGFIGSALINRLSTQFTIVGLDRPGGPDPPERAEFVSLDLTSDESLERALARIRYAYGDHIASVVHLAAYYDFSGAPSPKYEEITVRGTERLLGGLRAFNVEQFIFTSTMLVHAPCQPGERIDEEWPLQPEWPYPESKVKTEELIRAQHGPIPIVILRLAGVYDDQCHSVPIANQIQRIYERRLTSRLFPGDVSHGQAFVHLDDAVSSLAAAVNRRSELPSDLTLLIGEPDTLSYGELQRWLGQLIHGETWETREIPKALAKLGAWVQDILPGPGPFIKPWMVDLADDHYALDISRATSVLGWRPERSLRETLPKMVEALKGDPVGWYKLNKLKQPSWLWDTKGERRRASAVVR